MQIKHCKIIKPIIAKDSESIVSVAKKLHEAQERRVFIINSKKKPVGIISIIDMNDRVVAKGLNPKKLKAKDIMTSPINLTVENNEDASNVAQKMVETNTFYCPVTSKGILKGLITYSLIVEGVKPRAKPKRK